MTDGAVNAPAQGDALAQADALSVGTVLAYSHQFSDDEVRDFCRLVRGPGHPLPEHLPALLVIAPLTKLGGDLNYLSARMEWSVERPVRRDEVLTGELAVTGLDASGGSTRIRFDARILSGTEIVVRGHSAGIILGS